MRAVNPQVTTQQTILNKDNITYTFSGEPYAPDDAGTLANTLGDVNSLLCSDFIFTILEHIDHSGHDTGFDLENEDFTLIARRYARLFDEGYPSAEIFKEAEEILRLIKHSGREQLIISATEQGYLLKQVEYFELSHYFTDILGVSDVLGSSKTERAKKWIAERDVEPEKVLLIGDTQHDYATARAIGCDCVLVARGHNSKERLEETGCRVYDDLEFVKDLI